jgi:hypothetical protein
VYAQSSLPGCNASKCDIERRYPDSPAIFEFIRGVRVEEGLRRHVSECAADTTRPWAKVLSGETKVAKEELRAILRDEYVCRFNVAITQLALSALKDGIEMAYQW